MRQASLIALPRRPSLTAATTRERRNKARAWAHEKGLTTWAKGERECCDTSAHGLPKPGSWSLCSPIGGVLYAPPGSDSPHILCWDCCPYPGAPVRNWEHWSPAAPGAQTAAAPDMPGTLCVRCGGAGATGGSSGRYGFCCWKCGVPDDAALAAWLLRIREEPSAEPPWRGDKVRP